MKKIITGIFLFQNVLKFSRIKKINIELTEG